MGKLCGVLRDDAHGTPGGHTWVVPRAEDTYAHCLSDAGALDLELQLGIWLHVVCPHGLMCHSGTLNRHQWQWIWCVSLHSSNLQEGAERVYRDVSVPHCSCVASRFDHRAMSLQRTWNIEVNTLRLHECASPCLLHRNPATLTSSRLALALRYVCDPGDPGMSLPVSTNGRNATRHNGPKQTHEMQAIHVFSSSITIMPAQYCAVSTLSPPHSQHF